MALWVTSGFSPLWLTGFLGIINHRKIAFYRTKAWLVVQRTLVLTVGGGYVQAIVMVCCLGYE